jgi:hypothetical protein
MKCFFHQRSREQNGCSPKGNRPNPPNSNQSMRVIEVDVKHCTHLAVNFGRNVERDQGKDYDPKGGPTRNKVYLLTGGTLTEEIQSKAIVTYPYCPSKGLTSSDESPLVVEIGEELPSVSWDDGLNTFTWYSRELSILVISSRLTCKYHSQ